MSHVVKIHAWEHRSTKRIHVRRDCRAVRFQVEWMEPLLIRADDPRLLTSDCPWCFPERATKEHDPP